MLKITNPKKVFAILGICVTIVGLSLATLFYHYSKFSFKNSNDLVYQIESKILDHKLVSRGPQKPTGHVGLLAIDEQSLKRFGQWPISRRYYDQAFANLKELGVEWIGFDAIFPEKEKTLIDEVEAQITDLAAGKDLSEDQIAQMSGLLVEGTGDFRFASAIRSFENVVQGYYYYVSAKEADLNLGGADRFKGLDLISSSEVGADFPEGYDLSSPAYEKVILKPKGFTSNTPTILEASEYFGYFSNASDDDAINRWLTVLVDIEGMLMPSLALKTVAEYLDREIFVFFDGAGIESVLLVNREDESDAIEIPIDPLGSGRVLVNHQGPSQTFRHFSLVDAYDNSFSDEEKEALKGSVLLLAGTATGLNDMRPSPYDSIIDGAENHAAFMDNVLSGNFIKRPQSIYETEIYVVIGIGVLFAPLLVWGSALVSGIGLVVFLVCYYYFDRYFWFGNGIWTFLAIPCGEVTVMYISATLYKFMTEEKEKKKVKGAFQYYLSPDVIDQVLTDPDSLALGGEKKELTVFFSDVRSFTTISESLTPEKLCDLMNDYFTPMTSIILQSHGVLDKYIGDAIMAFWGAPLALKNSADTGCKAAIAMLFELDKIREDFPKKGFPAIDIGIGLNTGPMSVGNMGSGDRFTYTVMGDAVNLGSRLEGLTKEYGIKIMISENTHNKLTPGLFFTRNLDDIRVKGKTEPVNVFDLMRPDFLPQHHLIGEFIGQFNEGRALYKNRQWDAAKKHFAASLAMKPDDKASAMYLERIDNYIVNPPDDAWDRVYNFTHK